MRTHSILAAAVLAAVAAGPLYAADDGSAQIAALTRFSQAGQDAINGIVQARAELQSGQGDAALRDLQAARSALLTADGEAPTYTTASTMTVQGRVVASSSQTVASKFVPVDGSVSLVDEATVTERHRSFIDKAREFLHLGDRKSALETLKQGDVAANYTRWWLPIGSAERGVDDAIALVLQKNYEQAGQALKKVLDSVALDTVSIDALPAPAGPAS